MKNIKNIIFDLGGVVIDLDRQRAIHGLESLGITDAGKLLGEYEQKGPFLLLESGKMSVAQFYDTLLPLCRPGTTCEEIQDAFEGFLVSLPTARLEAIRKLRKAGYKTYMLSNTNPVMYNNWIELAFRQEGLTVNDYFDGIVVSFQERTCKPDPKIFRNVTTRYALDPAETLMLDDSEANCESARSVGLNAIRILKTGQDTLLGVANRLLEGEMAE
ncbi:MAG: HAD family phosphatase [Muribaculaceae bacterium]|nr:HAD family phosphatase [Muribaculaceae bacterium]